MGLLISGTFYHFLFPTLDILTTLIAKMKQQQFESFIILS